MRVHILGIAGTFMTGLARLATQAGHTVSGSDDNIYPPMSTLLEKMKIPIYPKGRLPPADDTIEHYIVGNVMSRGMPEIERLLDSGVPYSSGPQWLYHNLLHRRRVFAVAGTHGKTTTSSMLAWILRRSGLDAGYLIGGMPENFEFSSDIGSSEFFIIEADEYDSAFFDKRPKFLHYRPEVLIFNNLEHDHLDIYPHLADLRRVFHQLIRQLPPRATIIAPADDKNIQAVLQEGMWSQLIAFNGVEGWRWLDIDGVCTLANNDLRLGRMKLPCDTPYNRHNALAALLAAKTAGIEITECLSALNRFAGVKRRLQFLFGNDKVQVYEDFAHHPTSIEAVIDVFRRRLERMPQCRLLILIELGSFSMRQPRIIDLLWPILNRADRVWLYTPGSDLWRRASARQQADNDIGKDIKISFSQDVKTLFHSLRQELRRNDRLLIIGNRNFAGELDGIKSTLESDITRLE